MYSNDDAFALSNPFEISKYVQCVLYSSIEYITTRVCLNSPPHISPFSLIAISSMVMWFKIHSFDGSTMDTILHYIECKIRSCMSCLNTTWNQLNSIRTRREKRIEERHVFDGNNRWNTINICKPSLDTRKMQNEISSEWKVESFCCVRKSNCRATPIEVEGMLNIGPKQNVLFPNQFLLYPNETKITIFLCRKPSMPIETIQKYNSRPPETVFVEFCR